MLEQIAWGFCKVAFDASRDECFPNPMRRTFRRFGTMWFWLALLLERRALAAVCEERAETSQLAALTDAMAALGTECRQRLARLQPGLPPPADHAPAGEMREVRAWSLPDVASLRRLGLGHVWAVHCPFCGDFHTHVPGEGSRRAACAPEARPVAYRLIYAGDLPRGMHAPLGASVRGKWPRLLLDWPQPEHDAVPFLLRAA